MGVRTVKQIVEACAQRGIAALTLFAFSSENWQRPREEVSVLMNKFLEALDQEIEGLHKNGLRVRFIGNLSQLSTPLRERMEAAMRLTAGNKGMALVIAVAYGGRWDIASAAWELARRCAAGEIGARPSTRRRSTRTCSWPGCLIPICSSVPGRTAHQQLSAVESGLHRAVLLRHALARISGPRSWTRRSSISRAGNAVSA